MDWSAWTGNVIALAAIIYTWWTGRGSKQAAAAANEQAAKSLRAAQQAATAQQRMAEVMEKMYEAQERHGIIIDDPSAPADHPSAVAAQTFPAVRWRVVNLDGDRYVLTNAGPGTAYDVRVTASSNVQFTPPDRAPGSAWQPGDDEHFTATASWHEGVPQLVVTWRDTADGADHRWQRVLP